jgi:hypothetical protein
MNFAERTPHLTWAWLIVSTVILLAGAVRAQPPTSFGGRSRFDPTFANDVHAPRASDTDVLRTLTRYKNDQWLIVYGKFFGDGSRAAVVTGLKHASNADSLTTLLMYKEADGWKVRSEDDALNAAYCRVVPITSDKDILLVRRITFETATAAEASIRTCTRSISPANRRIRFFSSSGIRSVRHHRAARGQI